MPDLFGIDIAGLIANNIGPGVLPATLIKVVAGTRTPGALTGGVNPTATNYSARGFIEDYEDRQIDGTVVVKGDRKVILIGKTIDSLKVPSGGDRVTIEGSTYNIINVKRDPAAATYTCQVRGSANV